MEIEGYKIYFGVKKRKRIPPKAKIVDARNGVIEFDVSRADKGKYDLMIEGNDGKQMLISRVEVI